MKVLIIVDYQNDFVNGSLPCGKAAEQIEPMILKKIQEYQNDLVIFTCDTHRNPEYADSAEGGLFPMHCEEGTSGWEFFGNVKPPRNSVTIEKDTYGSYDLIRFLDSLQNVEQIEICGIATNICVLHNVILIYNKFKDIPITVDAAACASFDETLHRQALELMRGFGINVINLPE